MVKGDSTKFKCNDNIVREFDISKYVYKYDAMTEPICLECGEIFPEYNLEDLKPLLKQHTCNQKTKTWYDSHIKLLMNSSYKVQ